MMWKTITLAALFLLTPIPGWTDVVVDRCQSDTEGGGINLAHAVTQGERIIFSCPRGTTIRMTIGHRVSGGTTIDGEGKVLLDAHGIAMTMFEPQGRFALERLTIRNAALPPVGGLTPSNRASVVRASGDVSLKGVTIEGSESPIFIGGTAAIVDSRFIANSSTAVIINGNATIKNSRFVKNEMGLSLKSGQVDNCLFSNNLDGALRVLFPTGDVSVANSNFFSNAGQGAVKFSQRSGAGEPRTILIKHSKFEDNAHSSGGGAITIFDAVAKAPISIQNVLRQYPSSQFEFRYNTFLRNHGRYGGAINADLHNTKGLVIRGGMFLGNVAESGGAIAWDGRSILIAHSLFRGNQAEKGGALIAGRYESGSSWRIVNSLFAENSAGTNGGIIEVEPVELYNVTVARNSGIGINGQRHGLPSDRSLVANTIIAHNAPGNCKGFTSLAFKGNNLQFGHRDCPDIPIEDPHLDALYVPSIGSRALVTGDVNVCRAVPVSKKDIVFQSRATKDWCAIGAFERPPIDHIRPKHEH